MPVLPPDFYLRDTVTVARELLGHELVCRAPGGERSGIIVEAEAYLGISDPASHAFGGRRTRRTEVLFAAGGKAYIYLVYGLHFCLNITTREADVPECVLIRALQPAGGIDRMRQRGGAAPIEKLASGPGRVCRALGIGGEMNGTELTGEILFVREGRTAEEGEVAVSPRIGVDYAGEAQSWPLRFFLAGNRCVSRPRKGLQTRANLPS